MDVIQSEGVKSRPLVSVVMITYNHQPYIRAAIDAVLNQKTEFEIELVLADDCSTDGSQEVVGDYAARFSDRIRLIRTKMNVGMHANLLRAERACRGKYVAYCEGDDCWQDPTKLTKQVAFLEARPNYVMVHSHCHRYIVAQDRMLPDSLRVPTNLNDARAYADILLGVRYPLTVTVLVRRETLWKVLDECPECTDPKWPMADTQRWLELSQRGSVGCIHEPLATTNILPESAGQSRNPAKRLRFLLAARELQLHYLTKYPVSPEVDHGVRRHLAWNLLQAAYVARDHRVAHEMLTDFSRHGGRNKLTGRIYRWGSGSPQRYWLVYPWLRLETRWRRFRRAMGQRSN
jgi:glycosyltransferase involved in cell wall biosynthesis